LSVPSKDDLAGIELRQLTHRAVPGMPVTTDQMVVARSLRAPCSFVRFINIEIFSPHSSLSIIESELVYINLCVESVNTFFDKVSIHELYQ
jgi:hypothetical protein